MFQVRFHGRGGQGVTAAELLASAAFSEGRPAQAFPSFGSETLLHQADLFAGLDRDGYILINSTRGFGQLGLDDFVKGFHRDRLMVVPANSLT